MFTQLVDDRFVPDVLAYQAVSFRGQPQIELGVARDLG
jgi:hypothetical protein